MQILNRLLLFGMFLFVSSTVSQATIWFTRDGGGVYGTTSTTCNGQTNVIYTAGNGPNCAVNDPGYILGWGCYAALNNSDCDHAPHMVASDTLYIDGDSDITPGAQAQYAEGYLGSGSIWYRTFSHC